jgi:AcrR family transcriptional regulator
MADRATKQADIVRAATDVFLRYGFTRTTMGDLAGAARISRPALYLVFPGKEDLFAAVVRRMDAEWHAEVGAALADHKTLEAKLRHVCGAWAAHGIDVVSLHPDAKDLFDLRFAAVREMYEHFEVLLASLIDDAIAGSSLRATARELARSVIYAMRGIKEAATSTAEMRRLADVQISLLVVALGLPTTSGDRSRRKSAAPKSR